MRYIVAPANPTRFHGLDRQIGLGDHHGRSGGGLDEGLAALLTSHMQPGGKGQTLANW